MTSMGAFAFPPISRLLACALTITNSRVTRNSAIAAVPNGRFAEAAVCSSTADR
jgi:hypothetical protein